MRTSRFQFSVKPQEALLILITMFWGGTFLAVQYAVTMSGPFFFVGLRFATAALAVALLSFNVLKGITWLEVKAGVAIGVAIALGYSLQTWGYSLFPAVNRRLLPPCTSRWCRCCSGYVWDVYRG
jgi:drug/metabolite transporter (DMT)-like permease